MIKNVNFKYITKEEVRELIDKELLFDFFYKKSLFNKKLKRKQLELSDFLQKNVISFSNEQVAHQVLKECYFKNEELTLDDINKILSALKILKIDNNLFESFHQMLKKEIDKKEKNKEKDNYNIEEIRKNNILRRKKYESKKSKLTEELELYLDLKQILPKRFLNKNEVYRVIYILKLLNVDEELIKKILKNNELYITEMSIIEKYNYYIDRINYYKLVDDVKELTDFYSEILKTKKEDEEDKKFFENYLNDKLQYILRYIPKTYEFELSKN